MEVIAPKATIVLPILLLQKPSIRSKSKDQTACLERRLISWSNGDLEGLLKEGRALQQRLPKLGQPATTMKPNLARNFSNLIFAGKLQAGLDLLTNDNAGCLLHLDQHIDTNDSNSILISKHPASQPAYTSCIIPSDPEDPHPIIFESLDADSIHSAALKINGATGPSRLDAHAWRRLCTCFKGVSRDLCASLASVARRICSSYVNPTLIAPLLAS